MPKEIEYNINQNDIKANDNVNVQLLLAFQLMKTTFTSIKLMMLQQLVMQLYPCDARRKYTYSLSPSAATLSSASDRAGASYLNSMILVLLQQNGAVKITLNAELEPRYACEVYSV